MSISYAESLPDFQKDTTVPFADMLHGFHLAPSLTVNEGYDDNINLSSGSKDSGFTTTVIPQLMLSYKTVNADLSFSYQASAQFVNGQSVLNTVSHLASLNSRYQLSQTTQLQIQDGFAYSPDATVINPTGVVTARTNQYSNSVSATVSQKLSALTSVNVMYTYSILRYESSDLVDSDAHGVQLTMSQEFTHADTINTTIGINYFIFDTGDSEKTYLLSLGWMHHFSKTFSLNATGGANLFQDTNNHYTPSGLFNVVMEKSWKHTSAILTAQQNLGVSGGVVSGIVVNQAVILSIQERLTQKLGANLSGIYATNKSVSGSAINTVTYSGVVGFDYQILVWLKGQMQYTYYQQDSHGTASDTIRRNQGFLGLRATLPN